MIDLRIIAVLALITALAGAGLYIDQKGYNRGKNAVQTLWDADKAERARLAKIQEEKSREQERVANEATTKIQLDYAKSQAALAAARRDLNRRLCDAGTVPRQTGVRVATAGSDPVSRTPKSPSGITETAETPENIGRGVTLADALDDTLQCTTLIDWVRAHGM